MYKDDEIVISHVTRNDSLKVGMYAFFALLIAVSLLAATMWLLLAA